MTAALKLTRAGGLLRTQALREKDADKKKEILDKIPGAEKEAAEKAPDLLREVLGRHATGRSCADDEDIWHGGAAHEFLPTVCGGG